MKISHKILSKVPLLILTIKITEIIEEERLEIEQNMENDTNNLVIANKYYITFYHIHTAHNDLCDKLATKV